MPALAAEIITEEDLVLEVIAIDQLVRLADNAIFLFDTSSSMNDDFQDSGKSRLEVVTAEFKKRNALVPELGYNFGIYVYTPWTPVLEMQPYDTEDVAKALDTLPKKGSGPTRLSRGLEKLEPIVQGLSGRTVIFVFTDGIRQDNSVVDDVRDLDHAADVEPTSSVVGGRANQDVGNAVHEVVGTAVYRRS